MPAVVLDTNVVLDLWHFNDPRCAALRSALDAKMLQIITSGAVDRELNEVLSRPEFVASRTSVMAQWHRLAGRVDVAASAPWLCRDVDDQKFLDLAFAAQASVLVTKDKALLALARKARSAGLAITAPQTLWLEPHFEALAATAAR